jgi:hypothetical protein
MRSTGVITGELVVEDGRPKALICNSVTDGQPLSRVTEFTSWDKDGFPMSWQIRARGRLLGRLISLTNLTFGIRQFPDSDGYTPSLLGEQGRSHAILYSNRTAHVVDTKGQLVAQPVPPIEALVRRGNWSIWIGVVGLVAALTAAGWRIKR